MTEWRLGRGWSPLELDQRLRRVELLHRNFSEPAESLQGAEGWHQYASSSIVAAAEPGPPTSDGPFAKGRTVLTTYSFSDPTIVRAHFAPDADLLGRRMLLEMRALRVLRYLGGVVVGAVRSESEPGSSLFGFRYETLEGHIERGAEWFLLDQEHATGRLRFRIEAAWQPGDFPNWWSRLGFRVLGPSYQARWHRRAHAIVARLVRSPELHPPRPGSHGLVRSSPEVVFRRRRPAVESPDQDRSGRRGVIEPPDGRGPARPCDPR